jgi:hypothetical protein
MDELRYSITFRSMRGCACLARGAMTFDHIDDLQHISDIAKEDDVGFVRMAAQIGAKFVARASHADRRCGKIGAFAAEFARKRSATMRLPLCSAI